jgi:plastocyanin
VYILPAALAAVAVGCDGDDRARAPSAGHVDPGDTLRTQGVEIAVGRFVPDLVAVGPAQAVNFLNRDDVPHRVVKVSGPGRHFRSGVLEPGETYRVSLVGRPGWRLRSGTVVYRSDREGGPRGRIAVYGTVIPRRDEHQTAIVATRQRFLVIGHSRTGRDFVVEGSGRDPRGWTTRCAPRGEGACGPQGEWR